MKQYILITLASLCVAIGNLHAQESMSNPVNIGNKASSFTFTDTKNTENYVDNYEGQETNDVFYKFTLTRPMDVIISHCGSELYDTYVHLLDASGNQIAENDDNPGEGMCENQFQSYLQIANLAAGTYYVVSEGYGDNGNITTNIQGIRPFSATSQNGGLDPSTDRNYILTINPLVESTDASILTTDQSLQTLQYFDGLGRPMQTVQRNITPEKKDLVSSIEYDGIGRQSKQWLPTPIADNQGAYVELSNVSEIANSIYSDSRPYSELMYEASPLNRVDKQYGAGISWFTSDKSTKMEYQSNIANDVAYYYVEDNLLKRNGEYAANTLYVNKVSDEDGKPTYEFKDKQGQTILKRNINNGQNINTYYVYNDLGQLSYVLPPLTADNLGTNTITGYADDNDWLTKYAYLYRYDERGNNIVKRLPGCDYIYMVYDKADRMVLSQDGNQRVYNKWTVTKYDALGRVIYTGYLTRNQTREELKAILDPLVITESYCGTNGFNTTGYSCGYFIGEITPISVNYYDNYSFTDLAINGGSLNWFTPPTGYDLQYNNAKGLLTGTRTYILDKTINSYLTTALYYDDNGHVVQSRSTNHLSGFDITYNNLDFKGKILRTQKDHIISGQSVVTEIYRYVYDNAERLITTRYKLGTSDTITLATNSYDKLGRLTTKLRHNNTDTEQYEYNVRNWTTKIKSGAFEENLFYNSNSVGATPCFNGNISYSTWTYGTETKGYKYNYDELNQLYYSYFRENNYYIDNYYDEYLNFDKQGNITGIYRATNGSDMDILDLKYNGNQLKSVYDDAGSSGLYNTKEYNDGVTFDVEFNYDKNGNLTKDKDRNIVAIRYNILNLPDTIQFGNGNQIINRYAADGRKLGTEYFTRLVQTYIPIDNNTVCSWTYEPGITDQKGKAYIGNIEYSTSFGNPSYTSISYVHNAEGYAKLPGYYCYFRKDHLGNNREVWQANTKKTIQYTQYYPSGLPWTSNTGDGPAVQAYKYNGKEFDEMSGYDTYDYGARGYYPAIGRFTSVDPHAEKYYSISPYAYCVGNPIRFIDPNGKSVYSIDSDGHIKLVDGNKDKKDQLYKLNKNGELIKDKTHLNLNKGILENPGSKFAKTKDGYVPYNTLKFNNEKAADTFFKWTANNTDVEWSKVTVGNDNTITTTHSKTKEVGGQNELINALSNGANNAKMEHDHPYEKDQNAPSGFGMYNDPTPPNAGDRGAALQVKTLFPNAKVTFQVYDVYTNGTINYNSEKADDETHE